MVYALQRPATLIIHETFGDEAFWSDTLQLNLKLGLSADQKRDLVEYLKSL